MPVTITLPNSPTDEPFTVTIDYTLPAGGPYLMDCSVGGDSDAKSVSGGTSSWTTKSFSPGAGPQQIDVSVMDLPDFATKPISVNGPGMEGSSEAKS
ncbi:MAG TPA: hypothetical protein VM533_12915 [Fimbriiglobus sp.]|jgi:hypothetical protein|nr:hypothetical protein [Fimbriiglobus sp.]